MPSSLRSPSPRTFHRKMCGGRCEKAMTACGRLETSAAASANSVKLKSSDGLAPGTRHLGARRIR